MKYDEDHVNVHKTEINTPSSESSSVALIAIVLALAFAVVGFLYMLTRTDPAPVDHIPQPEVIELLPAASAPAN